MTTSHILAIVNLFAMMHGAYIVMVIALKNVKKTVVVVEEAVAVVVVGVGGLKANVQNKGGTRWLG